MLINFDRTYIYVFSAHFSYCMKLTIGKKWKYKICHLHFMEQMFIHSANRRRLKPDAVSNENILNT